MRYGQKNLSYSFLLRLWQVMVNGKQVWMASLEDPDSGERRAFTSLEELVIYLKKIIQKDEE